MSLLKDLTGKTFGDFYVIKRVENTHDECGTVRVNYAAICTHCAVSRIIKARYLTRGSGTTCKCRKEKKVKSLHSITGAPITEAVSKNVPKTATDMLHQAKGIPKEVLLAIENKFDALYNYASPPIVNESDKTYPNTIPAMEGGMREPISPFSGEKVKEQTLVEKILDLSDSRTRLQALFNHLEEENKRLLQENKLIRKSNNTLKTELLRLIMKRG